MTENLLLNNKYLVKLDIAINKLLNSFFYYILLAFIICFFWTIEQLGLGLIVIFTLTLLILTTQKNLAHLIPLFCTFTFIINKTPVMGSQIYIFTAIPLFIGLIIYFIRFKPKFYIGKQFNAMLIVSICWVFGGITARYTMGGNYYSAARGAIFIILAVAVGFVLLYYILSSTIYQESNFNLFNCLCKSLLTISIIIIYQMVYILLNRYHSGTMVELNHLKGLWDFGWGISNQAGMLLGISIPFVLYLGLKSRVRTVVSSTVAFILFIFIILSYSRGALLFTTLFLFPLLAYIFFSSSYKKYYILSLFIVLLMSIVMFVVFKDKIIELFENIFILGLDDNGRMPLFREGISLFRQYSLFGVGFDYKYGFEFSEAVIPTKDMIYYYHSTPIQILASTGLLGLIAYSYQYAVRLILMLKKNTENIIMLFSFFIYESYNLIDANKFNINNMLIVLISFIVIEKFNDFKAKDKHIIKKL